MQWTGIYQTFPFVSDNSVLFAKRYINHFYFLPYGFRASGKKLQWKEAYLNTNCVYDEIHLLLVHVNMYVILTSGIKWIEQFSLIF